MIEKVEETLNVYQVEGLPVMSDEARYVFGGCRGKWIPARHRNGAR